MSIAFGGAVAFVFRGMNLVVALATVLLTQGAMTKDGYGAFVLGLTVVGIVNAVTGGLTASAAYQVANKRQAPGRVLAGGLTPALSVGAVALAAGFAGRSTLGGVAGEVALPVALASTAVIVNGVAAGVFLGMNRLVRYNVALVAPPALALTAIGFTAFGLDLRTPGALLGAYAAGQWLASLVLAALGGRSLVSGERPDGALVKAMVAFGALAGLSSGVSYLNYRADLFVVEHFEGRAGVGTYSLAVYVAESVWQVSGSLALATYPRVGALDRAAAAELTTRVMRHTVLLLGVICVVVFLAAEPLESFVFTKYEGMASALRFILPGVLVYGLAQSFSGFYTYQRGKPWVSAIVAGTGLVLDMILAIALVPLMGVNGAALASALAYSLAMAGALAVFVRTERLPLSDVFRFGRRELEDYRAVARRLRLLAAR